ncbi:bifunctional 5,10-methylenetetrahydrofolate dehydrogenase/5,10-methenyltetrahydrofolate cyclohydrolase [Vagococcus humatus]|uniref:Bifunctional protein FolD n=1 Tax=Vagococcus humatus TaxID=1889241 RepID=A0A429Z7W6_9ENTE|nr:bifunctional 5,10-methylenetetrahydrofolate dehydrogenase/5,10-methenyltetrahydrofolate cyclohydrolase [Vagococcus humatus]RST89784.1 bifunctional 5,10-methylene-tetrahydrofolate dehydrogenase/5,10-methylene-tetrahydrofolate cyclohydrolase [Vagococcus humatus]
MTAQVLRGKDVSQPLREKLSEELKQLTSQPNLAIVRVGNDPSQMSYETSCQRIMGKLGIQTTSYVFSEDINQADFDSLFKDINDNPEVTSILLLKPLPKHLTDEKVNQLIRPEKDVDCIGTANMAKLYQDDYSRFVPCTAQACMEILDYTGIDLKGKKVAMIGFGMVIGKPLTLMLVKRGATVVVCHEFTQDVPKETKECDVLITATGVAGLVGTEHVNEKMIVIDVGINVNDKGELVGDVSYEPVKEIVAGVTPVPGGVGTVTNTVLASHVLKSYQLQESSQLVSV